MSIYEKLDDWITDAEGKIPQKGRRQKVRLYGEGVKSKLRQAEYSLERISALTEEFAGTTATTNTTEISASDRVGFYCDAYWAFLYSSLDILAQVINQYLNLGLSEKQVDFYAIADNLNTAPVVRKNSIGIAKQPIGTHDVTRRGQDLR